MFKLGLTGSIATGKSTVLGFFAECGVPVFSADAAVHELYDGQAVEPVEKLFPGITRGGRIDRKELSERLLANPDKLTGLEAVVHPLVRERIGRFFRQTEDGRADIAVADIPLLLENEYEYDYDIDGIAVTVCSPEEQAHRALARPGMTKEKLAVMLARQMSQAEKIKRADFIIDTDRTLPETRAQVGRIVAQCREMLYAQPK
jgi:dephospho-CoA kinase